MFTGRCHGMFSIRRAERQYCSPYRNRLLVVGLAMGMVLTACHSGQTVPVPSLESPDPFDHIAAQVRAGASRRCTPQRFRPYMLKESVFACEATIGDTTFHYLQDSTGSIILAGRHWMTEGDEVSTMDRMLQTQFNHAYGASRDCPEIHSKTNVFQHRQWYTPSFSVRLVEDGVVKASTSFYVQYARVPISCDPNEPFLWGGLTFFGIG